MNQLNSWRPHDVLRANYSHKMPNSLPYVSVHCALSPSNHCTSATGGDARNSSCIYSNWVTCARFRAQHTWSLVQIFFTHVSEAKRFHTTSGT